MSKQQPCYGCEDREVGCHSKCDLYKEFREDLDKRNKIRHDKLITEKRIAEIEVARHVKRNKRINRDK